MSAKRRMPLLPSTAGFAAAGRGGPYWPLRFPWRNANGQIASTGALGRRGAFSGVLKASLHFSPPDGRSTRYDRQ
ncbi:MAG: hypothetical protein OXL36_04355, partial [Bryobacterales bacterium]|nr:hypothetical protein [Bryobacterales bacterium]